MGRAFVVFLEGKIYSCKHCGTHLALSEDIMSKSFHYRHGKAYLFDKVVNVTFGKKEERMMTTRMHTSADIFCVLCGSLVGWNYVRSTFEETTVPLHVLTILAFCLILSRKLLKKRVKSTNKANLFLNGSRFVAPMELDTGSAMTYTVEEATQTMRD